MCLRAIVGTKARADIAGMGVASRTSAPVIETVRAVCTDTLEVRVIKSGGRIHGSLTAAVA